MRFVIALPFLWLGIFFLLPFALVLAIALGTNAPDSVPPVELGIGFKSFSLLFTDDLYLAAWLTSLRIAATSTVAALLLGYPMAYAIARAAPARRPLLLMLSAALLDVVPDPAMPGWASPATHPQPVPAAPAGRRSAPSWAPNGPPPASSTPAVHGLRSTPRWKLDTSLLRCDWRHPFVAFLTVSTQSLPIVAQLLVFIRGQFVIPTLLGSTNT
jgi:putrescine transport system permease protein